MSARDQRPEDSPDREKEQPEDVTDLPTDIPDMEPQGFLPPPDAPRGEAAAAEDPPDPGTEDGVAASREQDLEPDPTVEADDPDLSATLDSTDPGVRSVERTEPAGETEDALLSGSTDPGVRSVERTEPAGETEDALLSGPVLGALAVGLALGLGLAWMTSDLWQTPEPAPVEPTPPVQPAVVEAVVEPVVEPVVEAEVAEEGDAEELAAEDEAVEDAEAEEPAEDAEGEEAAEDAEAEEPAEDAEVEEPTEETVEEAPAEPSAEEATVEVTPSEEAPPVAATASGDFDPRVKGELKTFYYDDHFWWQFDFESPDPLVLRWIAPDGAVGLEGYSCVNRINSEVGRCYVGQHLTRFVSKPGMWKLQACSDKEYTSCAVVNEFEVQEGLKPTK